MKTFRVSAMGRVFLASKDIKAETAQAAKEAYFALWRAGLLELCGYDMIDYGVIEMHKGEGEERESNE